MDQLLINIVLKQIEVSDFSFRQMRRILAKAFSILSQPYFFIKLSFGIDSFTWKAKSFRITKHLKFLRSYYLFEYMRTKISINKDVIFTFLLQRMYKFPWLIKTNSMYSFCSSQKYFNIYSINFYKLFVWPSSIIYYVAYENLFSSFSFDYSLLISLYFGL